MLKHRKLPEREELFCQKFVSSLNGTKAAIAAGYAKDSAAVTSSQFLIKPNISNRIKELKQIRNDGLFLEAKDAVKEIMLLAFSNMKDFLDEDGSLLTNIKELPSSITAAITELTEVTVESKYTSKTTRKIKLSDKSKNLELLMRHLGELKDVIQIDVVSEQDAFDKLKLIDEQINDIRQQH